MNSALETSCHGQTKMVLFGAITLFGPIFVVIILFYLAVLGCIWSLLVISIAYRIMSRAGRPPAHFGFVGAICSALFFLPWLSFVLPSRFRRSYATIILIGVYTAWIVGPFGILNIAFILDSSSMYWLSKEFTIGFSIIMALHLLATFIWTIKLKTGFDSQGRLKSEYALVVPSAGLFFNTIIVLFFVLKWTIFSIFDMVLLG